MCTPDEPCDPFVAEVVTVYMEQMSMAETPLRRSALEAVMRDWGRRWLAHFKETGACGHLAKRIEPS